MKLGKLEFSIGTSIANDLNTFFGDNFEDFRSLQIAEFLTENLAKLEDLLDPIHPGVISKLLQKQKEPVLALVTAYILNC